MRRTAGIAIAKDKNALCNLFMAPGDALTKDTRRGDTCWGREVFPSIDDPLCAIQ